MYLSSISRNKQMLVLRRIHRLIHQFLSDLCETQTKLAIHPHNLIFNQRRNCRSTCSTSISALRHSAVWISFSEAYPMNTQLYTDELMLKAILFSFSEELCISSLKESCDRIFRPSWSSGCSFTWLSVAWREHRHFNHADLVVRKILCFVRSIAEDSPGIHGLSYPVPS